MLTKEQALAKVEEIKEQEFNKFRKGICDMLDYTLPICMRNGEYNGSVMISFNADIKQVFEHIFAQIEEEYSIWSVKFDDLRTLDEASMMGTLPFTFKVPE